VIEHTRLLDEQRKLTQALAAQNDALRTTQLALQATRDDYGTLYDLAPVGYVTLDATSAIEKLNRMAARLLGMDQADAVGTLFSDQVAQVDRPRFIEHVRHCLEDAQPRTIELTLVGRNQQNPCVRLDSMALVSASSSAQSVCFTALVDISESRRAQLERERMEARLQEVQRIESLGVLAGGIAHDFNNLLSIILGHATLGVGSIHNPEVTHASFVQIEAASLRAADLCKQMLSYSSRTRCQRRPLALNQLLEDTTRLLRTSIQQGIRFHTELAPDLPAILGDSSELIQLTMNLVINAAESMESGSGTVLVRTEVVHGARDRLEKLRLGTNLTEGEFVVLTVEDTGVGMNAATLDKMFEPFFTTKFLGRGLGLAVAFGVLRRHEAGLEVKSREGSGTSFRVWFPLCSQPVVQVPVAPTPHPRRRLHGRALLVDDDDAVRETTALMLQDLGFEVHQAHDGTEAIALYAQDPEAFAAVLLDLSMPGLGGREVFEALKAIRHAVRVLLISGFSEEQMTSAFPPDVAPAAFLQKPLRREALHAELEKMLEVEPSSEPNDASPVTVSPNGRAS
jgi:signal transduction histidine kinase/ActR/RegA family two-component response regulator